MLNKEKFAKEIIDIAVSGDMLAVKDGKPIGEDTIHCEECDLNVEVSGCRKARRKWANSEYVEPPVDWSKVAVDTPILVRDSEKEEWRKRYFAKFENGKVYAWLGGATSWSVCSNNVTVWKFAKLAESEE